MMSTPELGCSPCVGETPIEKTEFNRRGLIAIAALVAAGAVAGDTLGVLAPTAARAVTGPIAWPVPAPLPTPDPRWGQQYGAPRSGRTHLGSDYLKPLGTPVYSIGAGVIEEVEDVGVCGWRVRVRHHDGWQSTYLHMLAPTIAKGTAVAAGSTIAHIGPVFSGQACSSVEHLHFELRNASGATIDPHPYLLSGGANTTPPDEEDDMELLYIRFTMPNGGVDPDPKGVIGSINRRFDGAGERSHFLNIWGRSPETARSSRVHISFVDIPAEFMPLVMRAHTNGA